MRRAVRVVISGRVQRVGYRHWTQREAEKFGLDGWVRNLGDGTVEALFCGAHDTVEEMIERCFEGPRFADVRDIMTTPASPPTFIQYRD
jgi:acylphosphatase